MPRSQLDKVLTAELGPKWSSKLSSFDYEPLAAASIGQVILVIYIFNNQHLQIYNSESWSLFKFFIYKLSFFSKPLESFQVHRAVTKDGRHVAMKIQYPGVADSIESDIDNVKLILNYTNLIPEGLYLDKAIKVSFCSSSPQSWKQVIENLEFELWF